MQFFSVRSLKIKTVAIFRNSTQLQNASIKNKTKKESKKKVFFKKECTLNAKRSFSANIGPESNYVYVMYFKALVNT